MRIRSFIRRKAWMSSLEWRCLLRHLRAFEAMIAESATPVTPFLVHHLEQALTTLLLVARVEGQLLAPEDGALPAVPEVETLERIFEMRDRLRAAMAALERAMTPGAFDAFEEPGGYNECNPAESSAPDVERPELSAPTPPTLAPPPLAPLNRAARRALKKSIRAHGEDAARREFAAYLLPQENPHPSLQEGIGAVA